jgi:uncharacterized protein
VDHSPLAAWQADALDNRTLFLIILPTERCNFRCTYCYEDFENGKMSPETVSALKALLQKRVPQLERLSINWFGGEPLVAVDLVKDISAFAQDLARQFSCQFSAGMTTNGYLLDNRTLEELSSVGVSRYQITLDGIGGIHNLTRRRAGNTPDSFDRIWENLKAARHGTLPISILIRLHITREGKESIEEAVDTIGRELLDDERFSIIIRPISVMGVNKNSIPDSVTSEYLKNLERRIERKSALRDYVASDFAEEVCYAAKINSLMVRSDGTLGKCTVMLGDDANNIGRILQDGTVSLNRERLLNWIRPSLNGRVETARCPAKSVQPIKQISFLKRTIESQSKK